MPRQKIFGRSDLYPRTWCSDRQRATAFRLAAAFNEKNHRKGSQGPITHAGFRLLRALCYIGRASGQRFPSYEYLAKFAGISRATVARQLKALEAAGLITWVNTFHRIVRDGIQKLVRGVNAYLITVEGSKSQNDAGRPDQWISIPSPKADVRLGRPWGAAAHERFRQLRQKAAT